MSALSFSAIDWVDATRRPALVADEVHLWWLPLALNGENARRYRQYLSAAERARLRRLQRATLRDEFLAGRGLLYELISGYLELAPTEVNIQYGVRGKPYVAAAPGDPRLCFNYTDTGGMGLFAFAWDCELGVDLEWLGRRGRFEQITRRRFSVTERRALTDGLDAQARAERFLACWTRKEGFGKARGVGIHYTLRDYELCDDCELADKRVTFEAEDWCLRQLHLPPDYVGCLVTAGHGAPPIRGFARLP